MNCTSCGANLPPGAPTCPVCHNATPYNVPGSGSSPQIDPTVSSSQHGNSPGGQGSSPQYDPTVLSSPYGGTPPPPSTAYGSPPYGNYPPQPNPYDAPPQQIPYGAPPPQQYPAYGAPPSQPQAGYGVPPQPGAVYGTPPPPKKRSRVGLIIGIVLLVLLLACVGISVAVYQGLKNGVNSVITSAQSTATAVEATASASSNITPTVTSTGTTPTTSSGQTTGPSGLSVDPSAAALITSPQMASAIDKNFNPTTVTTTFVPKQTIYVTFKIDSSASNGYVHGKWYSNGKFAFASDPLAAQGGFVGYLAAEYNIATQGTVELYWCTVKDCSDGKLADVVNFTVSSTGFHWMGQQPLAMIDINRP